MNKILLVSALFLAAALNGLQTPAFAETIQKNDIAISTEQAQSLGIKTIALVSVTQGAGAGFPAKVVIPNNQLRVIGAPLEGLIESVQVAVGQPVRIGETLAELKSPSLVDEQREFLNALSAVQVARSTMGRDKELLKEGIIAKSRYQTTQSVLIQSEAALDEKRQTLALIGMQATEIEELEKGRKITDTVKIISPLDGFVLEQLAIAGQRVEAASPLYKIGSLTPMWLEIQMPAADAVRVKDGDMVITQSHLVKGRVISMGKSLNAANQTMMVRAEITENANKLHPEQLVVAAIEVGGSEEKQWQLPPSAVARHDGKPYVFVKTTEGFRAQEVAVENENASAITISGTLADENQVAVEGVLAVKGKWLGLGGGE